MYLLFNRLQDVTGHCFQEYKTFHQVVLWLQKTVTEGVQSLYP